MNRFWKPDAEAVGIADALQKGWSRSGGSGEPPYPITERVAIVFGVTPEDFDRAVEHAEARRQGGA